MLHKASVNWKYTITQKNRNVILTPNILESNLKIKTTDSRFQSKILLEDHGSWRTWIPRNQPLDSVGKALSQLLEFAQLWAETTTSHHCVESVWSARAVI